MLIIATSLTMAKCKPIEDTQTERNILANEDDEEIMETANSIVFRPLFAHRKQTAQRRRINTSMVYDNTRKYKVSFDSNDKYDKYGDRRVISCKCVDAANNDPYRYTRRALSTFASPWLSYPHNYPSRRSSYYLPRYIADAKYAHVA